MKKYTVAIGRKLGSGGREIGEKLAKELGINYYDKELIKLASEKSGLCCELFEKADEKSAPGIFNNLFGARFPYISDGAIPVTDCLSNDALFQVQSDVVRNIADHQSSIFVGRCTDYILRNYPNTITIFITAPDEARVERLCKRHQIKEKKAMEMIERTDKCRSEYYNYYTDKVWGAADSYHLCIDSSILGIDGTVDFLKKYILQVLKD